MIVINVLRDKHNAVQSFTMMGHAEAGPYGYDLVCAAASAIAFGSINALEALCGIRAEDITELTSQGGFLRCVLPSNIVTDTNEKIQILIEGMLVSFQTVEADYGNYIQIIDSGGEKHVKA